MIKMAKSDESRKRYNQRRRAIYQKQKLQKQAQQQSGEALSRTKREIAKVERIIKASYFDRDKGKYKTSYNKLETRIKTVKEFSQKQASIIKPRKQIDNERITRMQINYFRSANRTEAQVQMNAQPTNQQRLARHEQTFFFAATRVLWQGGSPQMRYENIVEGLQSYGVRLQNGRQIENLQDAVQFVKEQYGNKYPTMEMVREGYFDGNEEETKDPSPRPLSRQRLRSFS